MISPNQSYDAIKAVDDLDSTALNKLNKNKTTASAIDKIRNGQYLNALESSTLHKHLTRISGVDGETGIALKQAQKALGEDITASGNVDLTNSLNTANTTYAKSKTIDSIDRLIEKHTVQTETGPVLAFGNFSTGLKNWSLSKEGVKAIKFTPGLKQDITNLQKLIQTHPELKTLSRNPEDTSSFTALVQKAMGSTLAKNAGGIISGFTAGPVGFLAGEGIQWGGKGAAMLAQQAMKSKWYEPKFRKMIKAKVAPTVP